MSDSDSNALHAIEIVVDEEITTIESSGVDVVLTQAQTEWVYDPLDAQGEEVLLRNLHDAIEVVEEAGGALSAARRR